MYLPPVFEESNLTTLHEFLEQHSFGLIVSRVDEQPCVTHLPFLLDRQSGRYGTLIGHTAKANPQVEAAEQQSVLAVFTGPHSYVSPAWYEAENVVPTWNYVAVHATGILQVVHDETELRSIVQRMTALYESSRAKPWSFDPDTKFSQRMLTQITGFRIEISRLEGKWKLSQNHPVERQQKVIRALDSFPDENSQAIADLMRDQLHRAACNRDKTI